MDVLSEEDRAFFEREGYVVLKGVVPEETCDAVVAMLYDYLGFDSTTPDGWYRAPLTRGGMLEIYQHQALWDVRQHPNVHQVFSELYGTEKLWVSLDRANFNPPAREDHPEYDHKGMLHWDIDPAGAGAEGFRVQGVVYLDHTPEDRGGFCCVPGHHKLVTRWATTGEKVPGAPAPGKRGPADRSEVTVVPIIGNKGDLVIWDVRLLHGNGRNISERPRLAQYVTMWPEGRGGETARRERVHAWERRLPPNAEWAPGDPNRWEELHGSTATLTPLGRKLLGVDPWQAG